MGGWNIDTSFLARPYLAKYESPLVSQERAMSLRDMMMTRQIRQQQLQNQQLEYQQKQQDYAERQSLSDLLRNKPNASDAEIWAASPRLGPALTKSRRDAATAEI